MRRLILAALTTLAVLGTLPAFGADEPTTEEQKTLYAVGLVMARQVSVFGLSPAEFEFVKKGFADGATGKTPLVELDAYRQKIQDLAIARRDAQGEKLVAAAKEFLDKAAGEKGAVKTASGLVYLALKEGTGASPAATDRVKVNFRGTLVDGKEFDSSSQRGQPAELQLGGDLKCLTEGIQRMKAGGHARLVCPPEIAYGQRGSGIIPSNATVVFDVELLEVIKK